MAKDGTVTIYATPHTITHQNGFKVETVARAQSIPLGPPNVPDFQTESPATYIGTDCENFGGTLRKIAMPDPVA